MAHDLTYLEAVREALWEEMKRDERVVTFGVHTIYPVASVTGMTDGFFDEFGFSRVRDTPISEAGFTGVGIGAAMTGLRPVVDLLGANFMFMAMDELVNQAAKIRHMFGGQATMPVVFKVGIGSAANRIAGHSDRPHPMLMNVPGLKIIAPTTPYDVKGLLKAAIRSDDPVVFIQDNIFGGDKQPVPEEDYVLPFGKADVKREGDDVTIVGVAGGMKFALEAAEDLAAKGISAEVVDPRSLTPLDRETMLASVAKTGRLVVVDPAHKTCSAASEISASIAEAGFEYLIAPIARVCTWDIPLPFSETIAHLPYPSKDRVVTAVERILAYKGK